MNTVLQTVIVVLMLIWALRFVKNHWFAKLAPAAIQPKAPCKACNGCAKKQTAP